MVAIVYKPNQLGLFYLEAGWRTTLAILPQRRDKSRWPRHYYFYLKKNIHFYEFFTTSTTLSEMPA
jgi:hypothetical protein